MYRRRACHPAMVMRPHWWQVACTQCYCCSMRPDGSMKEDRGASSGFNIFDEGSHVLTTAHLRRVLEDHDATRHVLLRARAGGVPFSPIHMVRMTTHRCQACSLDRDSNPKVRNHQMTSDTVEAHVGSVDHARRLADQRWEVFAARGVEWVCPPPVPGG